MPRHTPTFLRKVASTRSASPVSMPRDPSPPSFHPRDGIRSTGEVTHQQKPPPPPPLPPQRKQQQQQQKPHTSRFREEFERPDMPWSNEPGAQSQTTLAATGSMVSGTGCGSVRGGQVGGVGGAHVAAAGTDEEEEGEEEKERGRRRTAALAFKFLHADETDLTAFEEGGDWDGGAESGPEGRAGAGASSSSAALSAPAVRRSPVHRVASTDLRRVSELVALATALQAEAAAEAGPGTEADESDLEEEEREGKEGPAPAPAPARPRVRKAASFACADAPRSLASVALATRESVGCRLDGMRVGRGPYESRVVGEIMLIKASVITVAPVSAAEERGGLVDEVREADGADGTGDGRRRRRGKGGARQWRKVRWNRPTNEAAAAATNGTDGHPSKRKRLWGGMCDLARKFKRLRTHGPETDGDADAAAAQHRRDSPVDVSPRTRTADSRPPDDVPEFDMRSAVAEIPATAGPDRAARGSRVDQAGDRGQGAGRRELVGGPSQQAQPRRPEAWWKGEPPNHPIKRRDDA